MCGCCRGDIWLNRVSRNRVAADRVEFVTGQHARGAVFCRPNPSTWTARACRPKDSRHGINQGFANLAYVIVMRKSRARTRAAIPRLQYFGSVFWRRCRLSRATVRRS